MQHMDVCNTVRQGKLGAAQEGMMRALCRPARIDVLSHTGGELRTRVECPRQRRRAWQPCELRRICPLHTHFADRRQQRVQERRGRATGLWRRRLDAVAAPENEAVRVDFVEGDTAAEGEEAAIDAELPAACKRM